MVIGLWFDVLREKAKRAYIGSRHSEHLRPFLRRDDIIACRPEGVGSKFGATLLCSGSNQRGLSIQRLCHV